MFKFTIKFKKPLKLLDYGGGNVTINVIGGVLQN